MHTDRKVKSTVIELESPTLSDVLSALSVKHYQDNMFDFNVRKKFSKVQTQSIHLQLRYLKAYIYILSTLRIILHTSEIHKLNI